MLSCQDPIRFWHFPWASVGSIGIPGSRPANERQDFARAAPTILQIVPTIPLLKPQNGGIFGTMLPLCLHVGHEIRPVLWRSGALRSHLVQMTGFRFPSADQTPDM